MSEFIKHAPCPKCGSKDNLGIYNDHVYCFGCAYYESTFDLRRILPKQEKTPIVTLPDDITANIPAIADNWLKKYEIKQIELLNNNVVWSEKYQRLIFPYFGENKYSLLGYQGRYFGTEQKPKWFSQGDLNKVIKIFNLPIIEKTGIILVEDIVSAIKVGRQYASMPLFGSILNLSKLITLAKLFPITEIILWLDNDKYKEAHTFCRQIISIGINSRVIHSIKDPKEYNDEQIKKLYNGIKLDESQTTNSKIIT